MSISYDKHSSILMNCIFYKREKEERGREKESSGKCVGG